MCLLSVVEGSDIFVDFCSVLNFHVTETLQMKTSTTLSKIITVINVNHRNKSQNNVATRLWLKKTFIENI